MAHSTPPASEQAPHASGDMAHPAPVSRWGVVTKGILWVGLGHVLLLAINWLQFGRGNTERLITQMVLPFHLAWTLMTLVLVIGWLRWRRGTAERAGWLPGCLLGLAWLLLTVCGNAWIAGAAVASIELIDVPDWREEQKFDAVVVLGGGIGEGLDGLAQLNEHGDRIRPALQMWAAGKAKHIVVTGVASVPDQPGPAELTEALLLSFGVPQEAIVRLEGENTSREMQLLSEWMDEESAAGESEGEGEAGGTRVALVTSAFHLPRALRLAKSQQLELFPVPAASLQGSGRLGFARSILPSAGALKDFELCAKEWLARLVGR